jgi:hypothetical protein
MFVLTPRSDAISRVNDEKLTAQDANQALRSKIQTLRARQEQLPELKAVAKALDRRFPPSAEQAKLYKMVTAAAAAAGIAPQYLTGVTVDPPAPVGTGTSAQLPGVAAPISQIAGQKVTINVSGSPSEIREFAVDTLSFTAAAPVGAGTPTAGAPAANVSVAPDAQTVTITGNMFVMPKFVDPTAPAASPTKTSAAVTKAG